MTDLLTHTFGLSYQVKLDAFEGPLDLLLHLIKQNEIDIYNIPMAVITHQYLEHLELMKDLNLDVAGEFLVMASTLIQIKSKMLLPLPPEEEAEGDEGADPRAELVRRLLEYQRYKDAAMDLDRQHLVGRDIFVRQIDEPDGPVTTEPHAPIELELSDLISAFQQMLARIPVETLHEVGAENYRVADRIHEILSLLQGRETICFDELFPETCCRDYLVATFLAMLELCKLRLVRMTQASCFGSIWLSGTENLSADHTFVEETYDT